MNKIIVYSPLRTSRLDYVVSFICKTVMLCDFELTDQVPIAKVNQVIINYSNTTISNEDFHIIPHGCLFEEGIRTLELKIGTWEELPVLFFNSSSEIPFDMFSAVFYLISRYEEYLAYTPDLYNRFPEKNSVAYQYGFLQRPLIDIWLKKFRQKINLKKKELMLEQETCKFIPTYDIDMAYSFKGKGWWRNIGGFCRDIANFRFEAAKNRIQVCLFNHKDPFDCFDELDLLHSRYKLNPIYFFLVGKNGSLDKNIQPTHSLMKDLIEQCKQKYRVGVHPSYGSHEDARILKHEIDLIGSKQSRQHYIRFQLPQTYQLLLAHGILEDYSMGYGSMNGFRASTAYPFYWFDLTTNSQTALKLHPFCFMDCNSKFEQGQSIEETRTELEHYYNQVKHTGGEFIGIWHNFALGTDAAWIGWMSMYKDFLALVCKDNN